MDRSNRHTIRSCAIFPWQLTAKPIRLCIVTLQSRQPFYLARKTFRNSRTHKPDDYWSHNGVCIQVKSITELFVVSYTDRKEINKWHCSDLVYIDELKCSSSMLTKLYGLMKLAAFLDHVPADATQITTLSVETLHAYRGVWGFPGLVQIRIKKVTHPQMTRFVV